MIYLFLQDKTLNRALPIIDEADIKDFKERKEKNGTYTTLAEIKVVNEDKTNIHDAVNDSEFIGFYDEHERFQLHRITNIDVSNDFFIVEGVHLFFDEAKAGTIIRDRRFVDSEAYQAAPAAFEPIGWQMMMYDTSIRKNINFYHESPLECKQKIVDTYNMEFDFWLTFDGQKITGKYYMMMDKIGSESHSIYEYGDNILSITHEQDRSEVYTSILGRGKGEEVGDDAYGRRITYENVVWSKSNGDPLNKPLGERELIHPDATQAWGYVDDGVVKPRVKHMEFEDIEDERLLLEESYEWLLQNCMPKVTFSLDVPDAENHDLGDTIAVIYREINLVKWTRVNILEVNHKTKRRKIEFGDSGHFRSNQRLNEIDRRIQSQRNRYDSIITQLKDEFTADFDERMRQAREEFQQRLIDALAEVEARRERMETEWQQQWDSGMRDINDSIAEAERKADENIERKTQEVQSNLDVVTGQHQGMIDDLKGNVLDINDFIGSKDRTLSELLYAQRTELEEKIEMYNSNYPNLVFGSTLENIDGFETYQTSEIELRTNESLNFIRTYDVGNRSTQAYYFPDTVYLEQGNTYTLGIDFRSDNVEDLDYIYFMGPYSNVALQPTAQTRGLEADGTWHRYYFTFDWVNTTRQARLMVGTNFNQGSTARGFFDTRQVHLYKGDTHNIPWSPSPSDNAQVVSQLLYEIRRLDDGMHTLATKTDLNLLTGEFNQFTNEITTTADRLDVLLQQHDNWLTSNGASLELTAQQVQSKVWLNDFTNINPNLIPFNDVSNVENLSRWTYWNANANMVDSFGEYVVRSTDSSSVIGIQSEIFAVREGDPIVLSAITRTSGSWGTHPQFNYTFLINENGSNQFMGSPTEFQQIDSSRRRNVWKATANFTGRARVLLGTYTLSSGTDVRFSFKQPKLEVGTERTAYMNAFSNIEQLAHQISLQVQGLDGTFLKQSDVQIRPNYVQLGSQRLGDSQLASIFRVSPESIDAISDNINVTGNVNIKGGIEALSLSVIEGNFARLFTARLNANVITTDHISGLSAEFQRMYILNANIERLVVQHVFTREVSAISINAIDVNAASVRSIILQSNVILSDHINASNALIDKIFATNAYVERLTAKSAFVRDVRAISIDAVEINLTTIMNRMGQVEGGINIRRPDGAISVLNGMLRNEYVVSAYSPEFMSQTPQGMNAYFQSGAWWVTSQRVRQDIGGKIRFNAYQFVHSARYLEIEVGFRRHQTNFFLEASSFGSGPSFSGTQSWVQSGSGSTEYYLLRINLGIPTYNRRSFYLYAYPNVGYGGASQLWFRILRVVQTDF